MRYILLTVISVTLLSSCLQEKSKELIIETSSIKKIKPNFPEFGPGEFYSIRIELLNNTDSIIKFWTMSCSWQNNWIFDNQSLKFFVECPSNYPIVKSIKPHERIKQFGIFELIDDTNKKWNGYFKIGFVLVKMTEVMGESEVIDATTEVKRETEVIDKLRNKVLERKDIIWSDPIRLKKFSRILTK